MSTTEAALSGGGAIDRYPLLMRMLHWLTAALIVVMFILGGWIVYFDPGDGPFKERLYMLHESTGTLIWLLVLVRVVTRLATGAPKLPPGTPGAVRTLASLNQLALYLVLFFQPLIGFADANAWGAPLNWYGLFMVPSPIGKTSEATAQSLSDLHWFGAALLLALLALHVAGAAYHGLARRDGVVRHMA